MTTLALTFAALALGWIAISLATLRWAPRRCRICRLITPTVEHVVASLLTQAAIVKFVAVALVATLLTVEGAANLLVVLGVVLALARAPGTSTAAPATAVVAAMTVGSAASNRPPRSELIKCRLRGSVVHHSGDRLNASLVQHGRAVEVVVPPIFVRVGLGKDGVPGLGNIKR